MTHYVRIHNGQVVEGPLPLSNSPKDSPNSMWGKEQLKANRFYLVDMRHDRVEEDIDLANPEINHELVMVIYPRIKKPDGSILDSIRRRKYSVIRTNAQEIIFNKYPVYKQLSALHGLYPDEYLIVMKLAIKSIIDATKRMESEIEALTTRQQIEDYPISFPTL